VTSMGRVRPRSIGGTLFRRSCDQHRRCSTQHSLKIRTTRRQHLPPSHHPADYGHPPPNSRRKCKNRVQRLSGENRVGYSPQRASNRLPLKLTGRFNSTTAGYLSTAQREFYGLSGGSVQCTPMRAASSITRCAGRGGAASPGQGCGTAGGSGPARGPGIQRRAACRVPTRHDSSGRMRGRFRWRGALVARSAGRWCRCGRTCRSGDDAGRLAGLPRAGAVDARRSRAGQIVQDPG
jgi:hypothetical protein